MRKYIYIISLIFGLQMCTRCNVAAGSYPYAETYDVKLKKEEIIRLVEDFKTNNPDFNVPDEVGLKDGISKNKNDHWYHIYFYYKAENKILYSWIREKDANSTTFALISLNNSLQLGNWKLVNKDFSNKENRKEIKKFEELILNKIVKDSLIDEEL